MPFDITFLRIVGKQTFCEIREDITSSIRINRLVAWDTVRFTCEGHSVIGNGQDRWYNVESSLEHNQSEGIQSIQKHARYCSCLVWREHAFLICLSLELFQSRGIRNIQRIQQYNCKEEYRIYLASHQFKYTSECNWSKKPFPELGENGLEIKSKGQSSKTLTSEKERWDQSIHTTKLISKKTWVPYLS